MELKIFRDGPRYIVGPADQACFSLTEGYADFYSLRNAKRALEELSRKPQAELDGLLRDFYTDSRFETACYAGKFGCDW